MTDTINTTETKLTKEVIDVLTSKLADQQTALYALISRTDLPRDLYAALRSVHSEVGTVVYDLMTGEVA